MVFPFQPSMVDSRKVRGRLHHGAPLPAIAHYFFSFFHFHFVNFEFLLWDSQSSWCSLFSDIKLIHIHSHDSRYLQRHRFVVVSTLLSMSWIPFPSDDIYDVAFLLFFFCSCLRTKTMALLFPCPFSLLQIDALCSLFYLDNKFLNWIDKVIIIIMALTEVAQLSYWKVLALYRALGSIICFSFFHVCTFLN